MVMNPGHPWNTPSTTLCCDLLWDTIGFSLSSLDKNGIVFHRITEMLGFFQEMFNTKLWRKKCSTPNYDEKNVQHQIMTKKSLRKLSSCESWKASTLDHFLTARAHLKRPDCAQRFYFLIYFSLKWFFELKGYLKGWRHSQGIWAR